MLLLVVLLLALLLVWLNRRAGLPEVDIGGTATWSEVVSWDFSAGPYRGGWGWGKTAHEGGELVLRGEAGAPAVRILPAEHGGDFALTAEVMLGGGGDEAGTFHLATRDPDGRTHQTSCALTAGRTELRVMHRVDGEQILAELAPIDSAPETGRWHRVRLTVLHGVLTVRLDGLELYRSEAGAAGGWYAEPHVSAEEGTVRVRRIELLDTRHRTGDAADRRARGAGA